MTALSADRVTRAREGKTFDFAVGEDKQIFAGSLVATDDTTGYLEPAGDNASKTFAGVAIAAVNNNPGDAGAKKCRVSRKGTHLFAMADATQAVVGQEVCAVDDQTVALAATTDNDLKVGKVVGLEGATNPDVWVAIDNYC